MTPHAGGPTLRRAREAMLAADRQRHRWMIFAALAPIVLMIGFFLGREIVKEPEPEPGWYVVIELPIKNNETRESLR